MKKGKPKNMEMEYDEETAQFLLKQFPLSVNKYTVANWKILNYIPDKYYTLTPYKVHGIEFNMLLLLTGKTMKQIADFLHIGSPQLYRQVNNELVSPENDAKLKEYFKYYKGKKTLIAKLPVVERKHYFFKYTDESRDFIEEVLIFKTKNLGKIFKVEVFTKDGAAKDNGVYGNTFYEDLLDNPLYQECTRRNAWAKLKKLNKILAKYIHEI